MKEQIGVKFNLKTDWKALFQRDTWFEWRRAYERDELILRRFTIINVFKWYCFQLLIRLVTLIFVPILNLAHKYWNNYSKGYELRYIAMELLKNIPNIKFFRMGKE